MAQSRGSDGRFVKVTLRADISQYQRALATASAETTAFGKKAQSSGKEIDKLSGRLRVMTDAALTLGPALLPLGASTIPVLTASLAGLGAAAGAIGVTVLAIQGLGDGLKALDAYQLEPTAANLEKMRLEMEKLGPSGAHFVHFLDDLEPQLSDLQNIARAGLFPGVEDGIGELLTQLPQVKRIVGELALGMGDLARDAGGALAGPKFTAFFDYLETDARPTLEAFARSTGNVAEGVANLLVAFAPFSRDFTGGLEGATAAFARWSEGLDKNASFQQFLAYIRESGPKAIEFLGALAEAVAGLAKAAGPMGQVVLPALTAVARVFATIANSPVGPALYTAAAAFVLFNRAASLTGKAVTGVSANIKRLGTDVQTTSQKFALFGARGGVVLAGAAAVGMLADNINRIDTSNLDRSLTALTFGNVTDTINKVADSLEELTATRNKVDLGEIVTAGGLFGDSSLDKFADNVDQVDQKLAQLVETGQQAEAADLFQKITDLASAKGVDPGETAKRFDAYALALQNVASAAGGAGSSSDGLRSLLSGVRHELDDATQSAKAFSDALAGLNGWLDKRQAIRDYRKSVADLGKALHDGFQPKDVDTIDAVGRNITQVASAIKDKGLRADFLQGARASLEDLANKSGPRAKAEVEKLIGALDRYGLTHATAEADVDDSAARHKMDGVNGMMNTYNRFRATAQADVNTGNSIPLLGSLLGSLFKIDGYHATATVTTVHNNVFPPGGGRALGGNADGGTVGGARHPYGDKVLSMLAPGEEVISNRHGQADRFRADRAAGRIPGYANGGTAGGHGSRGFTIFTSQEGSEIVDSAHGIAQALRMLQAALAKSEKALSKETQARDDLQSQFDSIKSTVGSAYSTMDPLAAMQSGSVWSGASGNPLGSFDAAVASNTARTQAAQTALAFAASHGLDGPLYAALAASGNLPLLQAFANLSSAQIDQREQAFAAQSNAQSALGGMAANAEVGAQLADANKHLDKIRIEVRQLRQDVKQADQNNVKAQDKNAKDVKDGVNGAASNGHRRGPR